MNTSAVKRPSDALVPVVNPKKSRTDIVAYTAKDKQLLEQNVERTSGLLGPIMLLEGHGGEIFSTEFHPEGEHLLSTGFDRQIFLWKVYDECENVGVLSGHSGAVMEAHFSPDGSNIYTCATDKVVGVWDVPTCTRIRKLKGHTHFVNSCSGARRGPTLIVSGSDDASIKIWDARKRHVVSTFDNTYQVTAVCFNDTAEQVVSGGIDNEIKVWDIRKKEILYRLRGHTDTVTGLSLSPDGSYVLSNSMDNTLRIWDIRPYVPAERCVKVFTGHQHNFEKNLLRCAWSPDGLKISAGSADRFVYIWDTTSRRILYKLPGHNGSVNDIDFHPTEPIIVSGSSDKTLYLGEIEA
ncbi:AGAP009506-PA [Anopheles gambiae str. PEST]|uniref:U5 small nuclear ribonucleoprotein 40 kDa protein n=3 Tax=gambiae species complex TaxID=44542 RepID=Q7QG51_ANOGA|nr:U5 small nuclear ribonucleoprotein 40 kDa protein [Anopheles coluzzii]XP_310190.3 U5 small nuclear ribonucleoprotein 40 kDa protein [Anopheles gambiae]EAA05903.3 AGAP009506-PA [Anopheles gambiae str. PEST]